MVIVSEMGPNGLDTMVPTANDHSRMVVWQAYDRLVSHGEKKLADGTVSYDAKVIDAGAGRELGSQRRTARPIFSICARMRRSTTARPVTAKDVKWSFDRAIAAGGFPAVQMAAGSLVKPEQFSVVDDHTFKATFDQLNKLTMPDLVVPVPVIVNSELAKKHATPQRTRGRSSGCRAMMPAAAPTRWNPGRPASRLCSPASTTGSPARCPS